ncbi:MAG: glucose-1-phosphate thymidylyltransferase [Bacillota bacterium]
MKGLILSGGKGTRLRPLTYSCSKHLIPIANKPVLFYCIENLVRAGIKDIGIIVGDSAEEIKQTVGDGRQWGASITFINQDQPLGLAHAVLVARPFLGDSSFIMYLGDNLILEDLEPLVKMFEKCLPEAAVLLKPVDNPQRFGIAEVAGGKILRLVEKPLHPRSNLALIGIYLFSSVIHAAIDEIHPSWRGELEITDAIQKMVEDGKDIRYKIISSWWKDTGRLEDLLEANEVMLSGIKMKNDGFLEGSTHIHGTVSIGPGSRIKNSILRGPVSIENNCIIEDSEIGPFTSIQQDTLISESRLERCIILDNCRISGFSGGLVRSLIGKNCVIEMHNCSEEAKLFLGDDCHLHI